MRGYVHAIRTFKGLVADLRIKSNHLVLSSRTLLYKGNNLRPYAIKVEFWVDGKKMKYKPNPIYI